MEGRESKERNDLFFVCSLIEYIGRKTLNERSLVVNKLGYDRIAHVYDYADVQHCENIDKVSDELIAKAGITNGDFDNVGDCVFNIPSHQDIGKVFSRLIYGASIETGEEDVIETLIKVYDRLICGKIEDFNSSFYYEAPQNILMSYLYNFIE